MADSKDRSLLFSMPKESGSLKRGTNHLFVVGINDYERLQKLENAVRDAQTFRDVLLERYRFQKEHVYELYDAQATRRNVMRELRALVSKLKEEDSLVIYFSGHGHYDEILGEGYWVPVDANYEVIDNYIPYTFVQQVARAIPARHILMVVDSCYSGAILARERNIVKERLERDPSRWLLASGRNEVVPDGSPVDKQHSPFAKELLDLLSNYSEEGLTTQMLIARLTENVSYNSKQTPIGQALQDVGHQGGQFVFYPRKNEKRDWAAAQQTKTADAFRQFIKNYPEGQFADDARWQLASLQNTKAAYRKYIDQGGKHYHEALKLLGGIEEKDDFERAKRRGESALRGFMLDYPESRFREDALAEIERIREVESAAEAARMPPREAGEAKQVSQEKAQEALGQQEREQKQAPKARQTKPQEKQMEPVPLLKRPVVRYSLIGLPILLLLFWGIPKLTMSSESKDKYAVLIKNADYLLKKGRSTRELTDVEEGLRYYREAAKIKQTAATKAGEQASQKWIRAYQDSMRRIEVATQPPGAVPTDPQEALKEQGYSIASAWDNGVAIYEKGVGKNKIMGLVDRSAHILGKPYYKVEGLANGFAIFHRGGKRGYLNMKGEEAIPERFDEASTFTSDGFAQVREGRASFMIDTQGNCVKGCEKTGGKDGKANASLLVPKMKRIPGGTFLMGSNKGENNEKPIHKVTIRGFEIGVYEVTQKEWKAIMGSNPSRFPCENCPVEQVFLEDIQKYINKLNQLTASNFRLPTEAEWEYAAGGGMKDRNSNGSRQYTYAGSNDLGSHGWYNDNSGSKTHPVGQKRPNGLGLYDMSGNVWEWCQDPWHDNYVGAPANGQARKSSSSPDIVARGGGWLSIPHYCRVAYRGYNPPGHRGNNLGFRLARTP